MQSTGSLSGVLLGTALGDALGLATEGMTARAIAHRFGSIDRFHLFGNRGIVSDDTEQTALVAQSLARFPKDAERCAGAFRWSLLGWFFRMPWGIGWGTLRACVRILFGIRKSGVRSAGNGAAMRAAVIGVFFGQDSELRQAFGKVLAQVTHTDPRAVQGALFVAEIAAYCACLAASLPQSPELEHALQVVSEPSLRSQLERARALALEKAPLELAAKELGNSGYVNHSVALAFFCWLRFNARPWEALCNTVQAGGDTDSNAAIVGAWLGAQYGERAFPSERILQIQKGPFGASHLRALAQALASAQKGQSPALVGYNWAWAFLRNLALYPVVLYHAFRIAGSQLFRS